MNCVICNTELTGRQKTACSRQCRIKADRNKRRESGKLLKANMTPEAYERKRAAAKKDKEHNKAKRLVDRTCQICGKTDRVNKYHAKTRPLCLQCGTVWQGIRPSPSKELAKPSPTRFRIPEVVSGGEFYQSTCIACDTTAWNRKRFLYCTPRCKRKATGRDTKWISKAKRLEIYHRDGWVCQICFDPVPKDTWGVSEYSPLQASLDHILPRALGGGNSPDNLRLTHILCNSLRGLGDYKR